MMLEDVKKRAELFSKDKTHVFIIEETPGRTRYWNGYVVRVEDHIIVFFDMKINKEFPILLESIKLLEVHRDEVKNS